MFKCPGCDRVTREFRDGKCILCALGPSGKTVEKKVSQESKPRGKVVKVFYKDDISIGNRGV